MFNRKWFIVQNRYDREKKGRLNALEALVIVENSFTQTSRTSHSFFDDVEGRERARAQKKKIISLVKR